MKQTIFGVIISAVAMGVLEIKYQWEIWEILAVLVIVGGYALIFTAKE